MMVPARMVRAAFASTFRDRRSYALAIFGITFGIWLFVLVSAFAVRALSIVYAQFPVEDVEVIAPRAALAGLNLTKELTDETVAKLDRHPAAVSALPRMAMNYPASGFGSFEGHPLAFEVGGFADGIEPSFVAEDPNLATIFKDWEVADGPGPACEPRPLGDATGWKNTCPKPDRTYCDAVDRRCHHRVPVIVSPFLLELYNSQFAPTHGLPFIDANLAEFIVKRGGYSRMSFSIALGDTMLAGLPSAAMGPKRIVEAVVVGVSPKAMRLGITMPIGYVERFGRELGKMDKRTYSSIVVRMRSDRDIPDFADFVLASDLRLEDSWGERFAQGIRWVSYIIFFFCGVILFISCVNIAYILFTQVAARRREIGLMRAVGATRSDVSRLVLLEAGIIGFSGALWGVLLAFVSAPLLNWVFGWAVPDFPLKPSTIFDFEWWFCSGAIGLSTVFCVLGGLAPSMRAANVQPAAALAEK